MKKWIGTCFTALIGMVTLFLLLYVTPDALVTLPAFQMKIYTEHLQNISSMLANHRKVIQYPPFKRVYAADQKDISSAHLQHKDPIPIGPFDADPKHKFVPQNTNQIKTLRNVCIVQKPNAAMIEIENGKFVTEKDIVVYDSNVTKVVSLKVSSGHAHVQTWPLLFETGKIPSDFHVVSYPAYFIIASHPGNLYHWIHDSTSGLYGAMKLTNRLNSTVPNQVLHRLPIVGHPSPKNRTRYADIIKAFSVRDDQNVYHAMTSGTCYPYGVFGWRPSDHREVGSFVARQLDRIYPPKCPKGIVVTLIQRTTRKILNVQELLDVLRKAGFSSSRVVTLEKMSFEEQWKAIQCTHILVGVQGAGLQWCIFLRPDSGLLELAYKNWGFLFTHSYKSFLKTEQLKAKETIVDWKLISEIYFSGKELTYARKREVLSKDNAKRYRDLWGGAGFKFADSRYDPKAFVDKVISLSKRLHG